MPAIPLLRTRLSAMMFLQFFVWSAWYVPVGGYLNSTLRLSGPQIGWIFSTTALGGILAPLLVGFVADRLFATERVLAALHLVGGVCLMAAAEQTRFAPLLALLMVNALCYMPTMALANSLAFRNIAAAESFPRIAVWGTFGWIAAGLTVGLVLGGTQKWFFYLAGAAGIVMAAYSLSLPHTPPKGRDAGGDVLGLGALGLLRRPSFLLFAISAFLICIPAAFYFSWTNGYLVETARPAPTALMTLAQFSEIFVMIAMPWFIGLLGLRNVLVLGMLAWAARFACFGLAPTPQSGFGLAILGLLLHGFCYCFVFVGSYIYVDKQAPGHLRASAQSLISFLMLGLGLFVGSTLGGYVAGHYPPPIAGMPAVEETAAGSGRVENAPLPPWTDPAEAQSAWRFLDLSATLAGWWGTASSASTFDVAQLDGDGDGAVSRGEFQTVPPTVRLGNLTYARDDLVAVGGRVAAVAGQADEAWAIRRQDWLAAQLHSWTSIWAWPLALSAAVALMFWLGSGPIAAPVEKG